jgi:hypothetical protein
MRLKLISLLTLCLASIAAGDTTSQLYSGHPDPQAFPYPVVIRPAAAPALPPEPITSLYKPLDAMVRSIVVPAETLCRKDAGGVQDLLRPKHQDAIRSKLEPLMGKPVFVKFTVLEVSARKNGDNPDVPLQLAANLVTGKLTWQSDLVLSASEKHDMAAQEKSIRGGIWPGQRPSESELEKMIGDKVAPIRAQAQERRPSQLIYLLTSREVSRWAPGEEHMARGVITAAAASMLDKQNGHAIPDATYIGLEIEVLDDPRPVQQATTRKAPTQATPSPSAHP